jgi:hypothetical protein
VWYFIISQDDLEPEPYRQLQQIAAETTVEVANEPYVNRCVFAVERPAYGRFVDFLDRHGLAYHVLPHRPDRPDLQNIGR